MSIEIKSFDTIPDPQALEALLISYYEIMIGKMARAGGPEVSIDALTLDLWTGMDAFFPPNGAIMLAHDGAGTLLGCGFLKKIRPDAAELKRLFVSPTAQGQGLGRKLVEARIAHARAQGVSDLFADTIAGNTEMLSLYAKLGFTPVDRYPENANPPEWDPWLVYVRHRLDKSVNDGQ